MEDVHDIEMSDADQPTPVPAKPTRKRTRKGASVKKGESAVPKKAVTIAESAPVAKSREPTVPEDQWSCFISRGFTKNGAGLASPHFAMVYAKDAKTAATMVSGAAKAHGLDHGSGAFRTDYYSEQSGAWFPEERRGTDVGGEDDMMDSVPDSARIAFYSARVTPGAGATHRHGSVPVVFAMAHSDSAAVAYMNQLARNKLEMPHGVGDSVDRADRQYGVVQFYPSNSLA